MSGPISESTHSAGGAHSTLGSNPTGPAKHIIVKTTNAFYKQRVMSGPDRLAHNGVLIIGAGLAGLSLALALGRRGIRSTVIEKQREITSSRWPIIVGGLTLQVFKELGVLEGMTDLGLPLRTVEVVTDEGETLMRGDLGRWFDQLSAKAKELVGFDYLLLLGPSEMRQVLKKDAISHGAEILEGVECKRVLRDDNDKFVGAKLSKYDAAEDFEIRCKVLIGADGYKSHVRRQFGVRVEKKR